MIEIGITLSIAFITGIGYVTNKLHGRIQDLDQRVDGVELRVATDYLSKAEFNTALSKLEDHMVRIEGKLDHISTHGVKSCKN